MLTRLPLQQASKELVTAAVAAATEATTEGYGALMLPAMLRRREAPALLDLIIDSEGPAGWAGFVLYGGETSEITYESSTFLAPRLRGSGMLARARCWQAHFAEELLAYHGQATFISSIAEWNSRSLAASQKYASAHGWPTDWRLAYEPHKQRSSYLLTWPSPTPHTCFLATTVEVALTAGASPLGLG